MILCRAISLCCILTFSFGLFYFSVGFLNLGENFLRFSALENGAVMPILF